VVELVFLYKDNLQRTMESTYLLDCFQQLPSPFCFLLSSGLVLFWIPQKLILWQNFQDRS
jgi:hypothetical protein